MFRCKADDSECSGVGIKTIQRLPGFHWGPSLNNISPDQLPALLRLLDELPKLKLDLSANNFDWNNLKAVIKQDFNPRGYG